MGLDLAFEPVRRETIQRAVASGGTTITPPMSLVTIPRRRGGLLAFDPVGRGGSGADGIVFGAFDIHAMMDTIISTRRHLSGLDMYLFDPARPVGDRLVDWHTPPGAAAAAPGEAALRARPHRESQIEIVDQHWGALLVPDTASLQPSGAGPPSCRWSSGCC